MKKIYLFLFILASTLSFAQKQKHTDRYYNSWRLGLNMGAMWQVADVRSTPGFAGGFTLEKGLCENKTNFFSLAIKGRGLWGNTYGLDYVRNYNVKNNSSLNGAYDPKVNYDSISPGVAPYIYNNYKTKVAEGALELQICFNRLRERTNILLNLWGGIGFTSYRTHLNLLNASNQMYNYNLVDSSGVKALVLSSHKFLLDNSYESYGVGSRSGNVLTISPSCGIGFGYRFNDYVSLLWEHKITFPQGIYADYMDGIKATNNDRIGCVKDYYHYSSLTLLLKLGGGKSKTKSTTDVNNYTPINTNTVVTTNPTTTLTTNPTNTVATITPPKPIVNITNPPSSPYTETVNQNFVVTAHVYNVSQRSQLNVLFNGVPVTNYGWIGKTISFNAQLNVGNNNVDITATNNTGSDSKSAIIIYGGIPPQITITTPQSSKVSSTQSIADVYATILNVESSSNVTVNYNGQPYTAFNYNVTDKSFYMQANLSKGTNTVEINVTNNFGQDNKTQLIIYSPITTTSTASKGVSVTITDPSVNPYKSTGTTYKVKAKVTGVGSQSQVTVTANGNTVPFNFVGGLVDFDANLVPGNNLMQVSASNGKAFDSKSTLITYEEPKKSTPPTVVILNPNPSPQTTTLTTYAFKAQTKYITGNSQLQVKLNGVGVSYYTFDPNTGIIDFNANLTLNSNNFFEVKATNSFGTANASAIVKQEVPIIRTKIICHKVDANNYETITINETDWASHQAHGDYEGACIVRTSDPLPDNDITICHQNADGSKQTIVVKQSTWLQHQAHGDVMGTCPKILNTNPTDPDIDITICHKNADGSNQTIIIKQSTWAQHQAHGDVKGECPKIITPEDPGGNFDPNITICHKNEDGTETKMVIKQSQWATHQAHGDYIGGNCAVATNTAASSSTVQICHNNGDGTKTTIIIPLSQYTIHRAHGDVMGECPPNNINTNTVVPTGISICHKNGDGSTTTMVITQDQWGPHRAHGDVLGACPPPQKTTNPGEGEIKPKKGIEETEQPKNNGSDSPGRIKQTPPQEIQKPQEPQQVPQQTPQQEGVKLRPR